MSDAKSPSENFAHVITQCEKEFHTEPTASIDSIIHALNKLYEHHDKFNLVSSGAGDVMLRRLYTRFSSALTQRLATYDGEIDLTSVERLSLHKPTLAYIFASSGYHGMGHLIALMSEVSAEGLRTLKKSKALVLVSILDINDTTDELLSFALNQKDEILLPIMLGWLNQRAVLSEQGEKNRTRLLSSGALIQKCLPDDRLISPMIRAWMYSSYASTPNKHDIKTFLNKIFQKRLAAINTLSAKSYERKSRPRLLVIHERFLSKHAMFRCYAPSIRLLNSAFELIALADVNEIDGDSDSIFTAVHTIEAGKSAISEIVSKINSVEPDIIYYPSLGMKNWTVLISNLRLAPIQIASQGHPATTRSDYIDYVILNDFVGDPTSVYSERVIDGMRGILFEAHPDLPEMLRE